MSDTLFVSTRKGLFTVSRVDSGWAIAGVDFLGDNVSLTLSDKRITPRWITAISASNCIAVLPENGRK
jgi:hypothetical protein